jgi:hypothetical protein
VRSLVSNIERYFWVVPSSLSVVAFFVSRHLLITGSLLGTLPRGVYVYPCGPAPSREWMTE